MCRSGPRLTETESKGVVAYLTLISVVMRSIRNYGLDCHALFYGVDGARWRIYQVRFCSIYSYSFRRLAEDSIL
jgi:hypothetical protein